MHIAPVPTPHSNGTVRNVLPVDPFDPVSAIGNVFEISASNVRLNLMAEGFAARSCAVGDYVIIEAGEFAVYGRLTRVELQEGPQAMDGDGRHALANAQLLTTLHVDSGSVRAGVAAFPRLGASVFSAHPLLIKWVGEESARNDHADGAVVLDVAELGDGTPLGVTPERLFGRHCALLGSTGGGKSWTVARLLEAAGHFNAKLVLLDPTGEYHTLSTGVRHISIGGVDRPSSATEAVFPYKHLLEEDLIALFRPDSAVQLARMRSAIKGLKLAEVLGATSELVAGTGCIPKAHQPRLPFDDAYKQHIAQVDAREATFDISLLPEQIRLECVYPTAGTGQTAAERAYWGGPHEDDLSECDALDARIESHLQAPEFSCIFGGASSQSVPDLVREFLESGDRVLRISLRQLSFTDSIREIVANAVGRHLLELGREGRLAERPTVVFVDEAHQFLSKRFGNERWSYTLDAFDVIAKEGRKFALTVCLATQRPRDIPEGVLSQVGTFIVHRLINDADRAIVERASGEIDREAARFLPTLAPGQAVMIGVDVPMPLTLHIRAPETPPESRGPDYQSHWR
jgi:hypothetical protein